MGLISCFYTDTIQISMYSAARRIDSCDQGKSLGELSENTIQANGNGVTSAYCQTRIFSLERIVAKSSATHLVAMLHIAE